ncbi:PadR family transcriptional regulator [Croceibacterium xixiisoli]|nr:PadR family transcriptional regulator [Croceibacterium xixiisoli]
MGRGDRGGFGGGFGGFGGFGGGRGDQDDNGDGRQRRGRVFAGGELRLVLLRLIADEPRHGYQLIKAIEELTQGHYAPSPGVVYPTLSLLADEGLISESENGDGGRKLFAVTDAGQAELSDKADDVAALLAKLARIGEREGRGRAPELFRAMGNLGSVLRHKVRQGAFDKAGLEAIVDIIDDAAKRIERL